MSEIWNRGTPKRLWALILFCLTGFALSFYLSYQFYALRTGLAAFDSLCSASGAFDCESVAGSRWAELAFGIPLSSVAGGWFLAMSYIALLALNPLNRARALRTLFFASVIGLAAGAFYFVIMHFVIQKYCLFCLLVDGVSVAVFGIALNLYRSIDTKETHLKKGASATEQTPAKKMFFTAAITVAVSVLVIRVFSPNVETAAEEERYAVEKLLATPPIQVNVPPGALFFGSADAPITVVEFSDFQCPHCKRGAQIVHSLMKLAPGKFKVIYRAYPLDGVCNPTMQGRGHPLACQAASVAYCAAREGKFEAAYQALFESQEEMATKTPIQIVAAATGMDAVKLEACAASEEIKNLVRADVDEGTRVNVQATPTFFINGKKMEGPYPLSAWKKVLERL